MNNTEKIIRWHVEITGRTAMNHDGTCFAIVEFEDGSFDAGGCSIFFEDPSQAHCFLDEVRDNIVIGNFVQLKPGMVSED